jgi:hypothetical protein
VPDVTVTVPGPGRLSIMSDDDDASGYKFNFAPIAQASFGARCFLCGGKFLCAY